MPPDDNNNPDQHWLQNFDDRQIKLINNCQTYALHNPGGLPGHQLMLIIAKMTSLLHQREVPPDKET